MQDIQKAFIEKVIENMQTEEALRTLFTFLHEQIPLEYIVCTSVDKEKRIITFFAEYSLSENFNEYSIHLDKKLLTDAELAKIGAQNEVTILSKAEIDELSGFFRLMPRTFSSYIAFAYKDKTMPNSILLVSCQARKKNAFIAEHARIVSFARPYLEPLLTALYKKNPEHKFILTPNKEVPVTTIELLKACPDMKHVVEEIESVAPLNTTVLIHGATGTGKELVARSIHNTSLRSKKTFVIINCAAIPETLLESELFGYEKGAFTGALQSKKGYFEQANKGTIFLDEIGELSLHAQSCLLRVLETKQIQKIGSQHSIDVDVRILAATNKHLQQKVIEGSFREDLYYRLNIFNINVPPLAVRRKDIAVLIEYFYTLFVKDLQIKNPPGLTLKTIRQLTDYTWPGNVRQLRATIEKALIWAVHQNYTEMDFSFLPSANSYRVHERKLLTEEEILHAIKQTNNVIHGKNGAASLLGIHPSTLRSRMHVLGITFKNKK